MNYELKKRIECNLGAIRAVRYNVDGNYCMACTADRKLRLYSASNGLLLKSYDGHGGKFIN